MIFRVIEIDRYNDEHLIDDFRYYEDARNAAFHYWKNLFPADKKDSVIEVRYYENEKESDYDVDYCLRLFGYSDLSNESLFDLYNSLDYSIFELNKEITRRSDRLEEWLNCEEENIIIECLEDLI